MQRICSTVAAAFVAFAMAPPAFAVDPNFATTVTAQPATVTNGTFAGYDVKITNNKPNPIVGVRLIGTTSVAAATFVSSSGALCETTTATNSISCLIGELLPGDANSASFSVTFNAPSTGALVQFAWSSVFDESGAGGSDGAAGTTDTALSTASPDGVTSHVPAAGATFFTGSAQGVPNSSDPAATKVTVPTLANATTAVVVESVDPNSCSPDVQTCFVSDITIPGTFTNDLIIVLRRDASTIKPGAKIANAKVFYDHITTDSNPPLEIFSCDLGGPAPGVPCIESRTAYTKKIVQSQSLPSTFVGDWEFVIRAVDNGKYAF
jgi:hypothetical protein